MKGIYGIVGMKFRPAEAQALFAKLPNGAPLILKREHGNPHDRFAVQVWAQGVHVGYVKGSQVRPIALAMDSAGVRSNTLIELPAKLAIDGGKWPLLEIEE